MNEESLAGNLLAFCKKEQLIEFCEDYDIPFKSVWKKARLAEVLEEKLLRFIPTTNLYPLFAPFTTILQTAFRKVCQSLGTYSAPHLRRG